MPNDGTFERGVLVPGNGIPRGTLDSIVARAGIPPRILDETNVEQNMSCETGEPLWQVGWYDVRLIGDEDPNTMIERACPHQALIQHNARERYHQKAHHATSGG